MVTYGLIGRKLGHSFSAKYFNEKFKREKIDAEYKLFEIPSIEGISNIITSCPTLRGLNVTIPYKQEVIHLLHHLTDAADEIGAVNTIRIHRDGSDIRLTGHNTDAGGFQAAIKPMIGNRKKALVLGQGGASKAIIYSLKNLGISVTKVSRTPKHDTITYHDITKDIIEEHEIIVNCTPLGMWPDIDSAPTIPYQFVGNRHLCFDIVYNPEVTKFMRLCRDKGAIVSNGLKMLYEQAELAYEFWDE